MLGSKRYVINATCITFLRCCTHALARFSQPPFYCRDVPTMYDDILHKPLLLRHGSPAAHNILEGLLQKEKRYRLGSHNDFVRCAPHALHLQIKCNNLYVW